MSLLSPFFLLGLLALAVPVLLHLVQRERKRVVEFPSLMFLQRIPYKSVRRRRLRDLLLLALRVGALALIVAAFARPFLRWSSTGAGAAAGPREVVVLLDTSFSMGYGNRWTAAQAAVARALSSLGAGDRASLVTFSSGAQAIVRSSPDRDRLRKAAQTATPGSGVTRYGPALRVAQNLVATSTLPRREVVLVSDFQRGGWSRDEAVRLPEGTVLTPVDVAEEEATENVSVTTVMLGRTFFAGQERVTVTAAISNRGRDPVPALDVSLEVGGHAAGTTRVSLEPGAAASAAFPPFTLEAANTRGTVRIPSDALPADNAFHFVVSPARPLTVVVSSAPRGEANLYLSRALGIGSSPRFDVRSGSSDYAPDPKAGGLVIVMNDLAASGRDLERIRAAVEAGAGLLVVAGEQASWPAEAAGWLPAAQGAVVDRPSSRAALLTALDFSHPVFEAFKAPRSGDFSAARFYRYRALQPAGDARILARFDDSAPALVERALGRGRVAVWASTLDTYWNDLAIKPVFLPFVHALVRHLAHYSDPKPWLTVGQAVDPRAIAGRAAVDGEADAAPVVLAPGGERLGVEGEAGGVAELTEQGFYEVRTGEAVDIIAANLDPVESDLTAFDPKEITTAATGGATAAASDAVTLTPQDEERRGGLWWYLLLAALALLAIESVIANRLSRTARPV